MLKKDFRLFKPEIRFVNPQTLPMTDARVSIVARHDIELIVTEHHPGDDTTPTRARGIIKQSDAIGFIDALVNCYNYSRTTSQSKLELIEWNPLNTYLDDETGEYTSSNLPDQTGPCLVLFKDGTVAFDEYEEDEVFDEKTGESRWVHYFDRSGVDLIDIEAWAEMPKGYMMEEKK
nr:MAG TPA: hypothetical protein [Bacteriophage sp.]